MAESARYGDRVAVPEPYSIEHIPFAERHGHSARERHVDASSPRQPGVMKVGAEDRGAEESRHRPAPQNAEQVDEQDDIVAGICSCLTYDPRDTEGIPFDVFNLGNSHPVTLAQLVEHLQQATGRTATLEPHPMQPGDVPLTWADVSKAQRLLDFKPSVPLPEGLRRFVSWYRASADVLATQAAYV